MPTSGVSVIAPGRRQVPATRSVALVALLAAAGAGLYLGWRLFWFLTDDAFIAFRYISNSRLGFGYTWNLPPFRHVEGYTSFLWVALLDVIWRATGVQPPDSANVASLIFAYGTTSLAVAMLLRMRLKPSLARVRLPLLAIVLLGMLTNRTYLAWTSSGLETAMFNFFLTAWVFCCLCVPAHAPAWPAWVSLTAVLAALTRPDGLLLVVATLLLGAMRFLGRLRPRRFRWRSLVPMAPLLAAVAHLAWRRCYYGDWLPNTAAAKTVAPWPESGLRYLLSFVLEYALWLWLALAALYLARTLRGRRWSHPARQLVAWLRDPAPSRPLIVLTVVATLVAHFLYYTLLIGGDHFEYRVYSHLVPFIFLSAVWLLNALDASTLRALAFIGALVLCALPVPWLHWKASQPLTTREQTFRMHVRVAPLAPALVRPYFQLFDDLQFWLIERSVCVRHQEHKVFCQQSIAFSPSREQGMLLAEDGHPVYVAASVGVVGWVLPTTSIVDCLGLNDRVIAHNRVDPSLPRQMAHDRRPPLGYPACFGPNVKLVAGNKIVVAQRDGEPEARIRDCEDRTWPLGSGELNWYDDNLETARVVDRYLWAVWPQAPLYLYYVPPEQDSARANAELLTAFSDYTGIGTLVMPPVERLAGRSDYLFAFLPAKGRLALSELAAPFPWTQMVQERGGSPAFAYHLGYAAPAGPEARPAPEHPSAVAWGNGVRLLGYDLPRPDCHPGETVYLTLYYRVDDPPSAGQNFFLHLVGAIPNPATLGPLWAQDDGEPGRGLFPPTLMEPGTVVASRMALAIPQDAPAGDYELLTGFYDWQTGKRVRLSADPAGADSAGLGRIRIGPS